MLKNILQKNSTINQYNLLVNEINLLETNLKTLTDNEIKTKSIQLQNRYKKDQNLDSLISEAFALTREASIRKLGLRHFDVQLI